MLDPNPSSTTNVFWLFTFLAAYFVILLVVFLAAYIISSIFTAILFQKAGVDKKWRAWVPIYNSMIMLKLGDINPWWWLINFVPILGNAALFVLTIMAYYRMNLKLGKSPAGFTVLAAFLPVIWLIIVAVDRSRWNAAAVAAPEWSNSVLADRVRFDGVPNQGYLTFNR